MAGKIKSYTVKKKKKFILNQITHTPFPQKSNDQMKLKSNESQMKSVAFALWFCLFCLVFKRGCVTALSSSYCYYTPQKLKLTFAKNKLQMRKLQLCVHRGGGGGYFITRSYIGMCLPKGMVFAPFQTEKGYRFCPFCSGIGYSFRGNYESI